MTKKRACQVIIATHSLFALTDGEPAQFLVVNRSPDSGGSYRYTCGPNPEYSLALFKAYWRTGALFLGTAGSARPLRALTTAAFTSIERLGRERPLSTALIVSIMASAIFALMSDLANFLHLQSSGQHIVLIRLVVAFGLLIGPLLALLFWAKPARRRNKKNASMFVQLFG